ncbi:MAG: OsmC family protein, partial [Chloroflexi bacterium]|nr:OsmC family protein [Chloroflexota bacterium]
GEDAGPMPTEFFLVSIASCMCLAVYHIARKRRISLDKLEVSAWGHKDMQAFRFNEIHVLVESNLDEIEKLVDLAKAYCFVSNTIIQGCPIHVTASQLEPREQ